MRSTTQEARIPLKYDNAKKTVSELNTELIIIIENHRKINQKIINTNDKPIEQDNSLYFSVDDEDWNNQVNKIVKENQPTCTTEKKDNEINQIEAKNDSPTEPTTKVGNTHKADGYKINEENMSIIKAT